MIVHKLIVGQFSLQCVWVRSMCTFLGREARILSFAHSSMVNWLLLKYRGCKVSPLPSLSLHPPSLSFSIFPSSSLSLTVSIPHLCLCLSLSLSPSLSLFLSLCLYLSVCLSVSLFESVSACLSVYLSVCLSVSLVSNAIGWYSELKKKSIIIRFTEKKHVKDPLKRNCLKPHRQNSQDLNLCVSVCVCGSAWPICSIE